VDAAKPSTSGFRSDAVQSDTKITNCVRFEGVVRERTLDLFGGNERVSNSIRFIEFKLRNIRREDLILFNT
jgi:hypothetical protein